MIGMTLLNKLHNKGYQISLEITARNRYGVDFYIRKWICNLHMDANVVSEQ